MLLYFMMVVLQAHHWRKADLEGSLLSAALTDPPRSSHWKLTCRENARRAGIGINAAIKKAVTLLMDVRATLAPVRLRHSPVLS